jgi:hypothetical protein
LPRTTPDELAGARITARVKARVKARIKARVKACAGGMQTEGTSVQRLRSSFLPASSLPHCCSEGANLDAVTELNRRAGLPDEQIAEVAETTPASA